VMLILVGDGPRKRCARPCFVILVALRSSTQRCCSIGCNKWLERVVMPVKERSSSDICESTGK
jgi:hypothetical protein